MKCKQIKKQLYLYVGNDLNVNQKDKIKNHLSTCEVCSNELEKIKQYIGITVDSLKAEYNEPNPQVLWQQIQGEIESTSKNEKPERTVKRIKIFESIFFKQPFHSSYKTVFGLTVSFLLILLVFSFFTLKDTDRKHIAINNQKTVSDLDKYPVVEAVEKRNVTVMTMQTDDPKIKVVWFFDKEFKI